MHERSLQMAMLNLSLLTMKIVVASGVSLAHGADDAKTVVETFRRAWADQPGHMRKIDDDGWKTRMRALSRLAQIGAPAVPYLTEELNDETSVMRVFAAQALSFLASSETIEPLKKTAAGDTHAAARLYAVDALGRCGGLEKGDLDAKISRDKNGDVRSYVRFALERKGRRLSAEVQQQLAGFDPGKIDTAEPGQAAPDFTLSSARGKTYRLSQFRGKKTVVLIFIYGDT